MSEITTPISKSASKAKPINSNRIVLILTAIYQALTIVVFALIAISALNWFQTPFIGALVDNTLLINALKPARPGSWSGMNAGLGYQDKITAIEETPIKDFSDFIYTLKLYQYSDVVTITVESPDQAVRDVNVELQVFPVADRMTLLVIPYIIGLIYLGSGLWVLGLRRADESGRAFSLFTASAAVSIAGFMEISTTNNLTYLWSFSLAMAGGAFVNFALIFPEEAGVIKRWPRFRWIGYLVTFVLTVITFSTLLNYSRPYLSFIFLGIAAIIFLSFTTVCRLQSSSPIVRQQGTVVLWGFIFSFAPLAIWFFINTVRPGIISFSPYLLLPLALFPISVAYAILQFRLLNTDYLLRQALLYALLSILVAVGYVLLVSGFSLIFGNVIPANNPFIVGFMIFLLALLMNPLRNRFQGLIDKIFFKGSQVYKDLAQEYGQKINSSMDLVSIGNLLREFIYRSLLPGQFHLFVLDSLREQYVATPDDGGRPSTDIQFSLESPLPQIMARENTYVVLGDDQNFPAALLLEKARITLLNAQLFIPLPGRTDLALGFIALTPRRSNEPYTNLDLDFLKSLCDQTAMAVERAQVVADLERRVNEMNVLTRVAQGINITLRFDDILELIYAQANRIIPVKDFWILLYDQINNFHYYAFYLENDRRLLEYENQPLGGDIDLAQEVIRTGQRIMTEDYESASRGRGIIPQVSGIYTWAGVPLNAGAETIGALSLGSQESSILFADDQMDLLQAIADQAAGAIVKARLLEESERSARQLNLLNEVARNLTSTLELSNLFDQILDNAIDIIGCEAGTLFLIDDDTGELIFEVVKGPVASELQGKRLRPGTGNVGRCVETRMAVIVNEARQTQEWPRKPDQETGFQARDLLIVPMFAQEKIVGLIEVINRRDGLPITQEDQDLLTAFTSQAAIALENARLYTLTDQQLADRVDELSVMQRIDRELNASLDVSRAMRITLDWAMMRSGADAGFVGVIAEDGVRVMADRGYTNEIDTFRDTSMPIKLPGIKQAVDDEKTQQFRRSEFETSDQEPFNLLADAHCQLIIPIRREESVIGLLLIERLRDESWTEEVQEFLSRLSDHAAISIANAQLFSQVQEADIAKSEFVSFVSHELKTPMTSIRGYTDLLLGGAVGDVNEAQENFLATIRTNVNRMATLVSDLADVSRIEAGRLRLEFSAVSISEIVKEVSRSQAHSLDGKGQQLVVSIQDDLPLIWGDQTRIIQVLTNLVRNANKYTPQGGTITISANQTENLWDPDGAPEVMLVAVKDTGIGMKEEDQAQIFTKFFRSADPKAREAPGTGLGLNITRYLVEMQGGRIWFESQYEKGTTFLCTIPIAEV